MEAVKLAYVLVNQLPKNEQFALADQMRRSAVSIPSNIAEGQKRFGKAEMAHFCSIALGSTAELETQTLLCEQLYQLDGGELIVLLDEISKMLTVLISNLRTKN